jgi:hypothetical protein
VHTEKGAKSFSKNKFGNYFRKNISNRLYKWLSEFSTSLHPILFVLYFWIAYLAFLF